MSKKTEQFIKLLVERGMDAALVTKPENMRYLTGFTGEGAVYLSEGENIILTDFRYTEQAGRQAGKFKCLRVTQTDESIPNLVRELFGERQVLGIEMNCMTVADFRLLEHALPGRDFGDISGLSEGMRAIKDEREAELIAKAGRIACEAFDRLLGCIGPGMTEREVQRTLDNLMLECGSEEPAFHTIACSGVNGSLPHAIPGDYRLKKGELLTLDFGAQVEGYKSDMTRTVAIGPVAKELTKIYETVLKAQLRALDIIKPGAVCSDVDKEARSFIDTLYPGAFGHGLGHSVGLEIHEKPVFTPRCDTVLQPGHVMTVEPGIYIPGLGGCRIEDMVILTDSGYHNLISAPKELIIL